MTSIILNYVQIQLDISNKAQIVSYSILVLHHFLKLLKNVPKIVNEMQVHNERGLDLRDNND